MDYLLLLLPVILPVLFWTGYHLYVDRHLPEPPSHLIIAFVLGAGSYYLGLTMYDGLDLLRLRYDAYLLADSDLARLFTYAVLVIGPVEELAKVLPFLLIMPLFREFDEPLDGIIYGSFIGLGFAAVENFHYLEYLSAREAYARGFAGPVVHIVFASVWGYYIGRAFLFRRRLGLTILGVLAFTAFVHGVYDFIVIGLPDPLLPVAALLITGLWIWRLSLIRDLHAAPRAQ